MRKKPVKIIKVGRPSIFETPEDLWKAFLMYIQHETDNPWLKIDYVGQHANKVVIPLATPVTLEGFEVWLFMEKICSDIGHIAANRDNKYSKFVPIISKIRGYCFSQNLKGASVGAFNASIIARKLGLTDKTQTEIAVKDISEIKFSMKRRE